MLQKWVQNPEISSRCSTSRPVVLKSVGLLLNTIQTGLELFGFVNSKTSNLFWERGHRCCRSVTSATNIYILYVFSHILWFSHKIALVHKLKCFFISSYFKCYHESNENIFAGIIISKWQICGFIFLIRATLTSNWSAVLSCVRERCTDLY